MNASDPFSAVWKILAIQASVAIALPALLLIFFGWPQARSGFLGGLIGFLPNAWFALRVITARGKAANEIVGAFYSGESIKLILTAGLFFFVFQLPNILYGPLFGVFAAVVFMFWFALLFSRTERK
ncbi:MAG: ATP synthase subunit I [Methylococcales bacterium]